MGNKDNKDSVVISDKVLGYINSFEKLEKHLLKYPKTTIRAAVTRLSNIFDQHNFVYCTFSGGKDSAVTTYLSGFLIWLRRRVKNGNLTLESYNEITGGSSTMEMILKDMQSALMTMHMEMCYTYTGEAYERMFKTFCGKYEIGDLSWVDKKNKENNPGCYSFEEIEGMTTEEIQELVSGYGKAPLMDGYLCCFPIAWENMVSLEESRYWSFDENLKDIWTMARPEGNYVWHGDNFYEFPMRYGLPPIMDDIVTQGQTDQELRVKFSKWVRKAEQQKFEEDIEEILDELGA